MREINKVVIHCAATKPDMDIGVKEIDRWHRQRGFFSVGYHYVIRRDGVTEMGRPEEVVGAHARGHNKDSIGVCLVGGIDDQGKPENNFTPEQWGVLANLIRDFEERFPGIEIVGHRDLPNVSKDCPCFDVITFLEEINNDTTTCTT